MWLNTNLTVKNGTKIPYSHLFISQDTGSAIKGVIRGDIFFGYGKEAEEKAFYMASKGNYYVLLPINLVDRLRKN
jgi:membrane-bound lytic murein transglycosylase A